MPKRLILLRITFSVLRRGSSSCHVPERRLVIRFQFLEGEGTGMARSDNTFNRFAFDSKPCYWLCCVCTYLLYEVLAPICILIQHLRSFCMVWWYTCIGFVNRLRKASALFEQLLAPGTSTSSTATPCAGTNQDEAHLHHNLDNCYTGEPWLHVKILPTDNSLCLHSVCFHPNCTFTFFFEPRSTFPTEELPFHMKVLMPNV